MFGIPLPSMTSQPQKIMNLHVKIGEKISKNYKIPDQYDEFALKRFVKEELSHVFEGISATDMVIKTKNNEPIPSTLQTVAELANEDGLIEIVLDEPVERMTEINENMGFLEADFREMIAHVKHGESMTLSQFMSMSENSRMHWYSELSTYIDHSIVFELKEIISAAKKTAVEGAKYKLAMNDVPLSVLPSVRDDPLWLESLNPPFSLTRLEMECIRDYSCPLMPPNYAAPGQLPGNAPAAMVENGIIKTLRADIAHVRAEIEIRVRATKMDTGKNAGETRNVGTTDKRR